MIVVGDLYQSWSLVVGIGIQTFYGTNFVVVPIVGPYAVSPGLSIGDLSLAQSGSFSTLLETDGGDVGIDPVTGLQKLVYAQLADGGWTWDYDGISPPSPLKVYGFALCDTSVSILLCVTEPIIDPPAMMGPSLILLGEMSGLFSPAPLT